MAASCIYCGATSNLNTQLSITVDDAKVTVQVCDAHAEDASVKTAKAAYIERQSKIDEFKKMAASLGLEIKESTNKSGIVEASAERVAPAPQATPRQQSAPAIDETDADMIDTARIDAKSNRPIISTGGSLPGFGAVEGRMSHDLNSVRELIPEEALKGKVKLEAVAGRAGVPVAIPTRRIDKLGTTVVKVVDNGGDQALQRRFKDMANGTKSDRHQGFGPHGQGYDNSTRICPICRGVQKVRSRGVTIDCPKCGGDGEIFV